MRINIFGALLAFAAGPAFAGDMDHADHGNGIHHMIELETAYGANRDHDLATWDLDGWIGGDQDKLWLKSEGEHGDNTLETAEFQALYSRNIDTFWDVQAGIRYDSQPETTYYGVLGLQGLAPYYIETEAHLFLSDEGDVTARLHLDTDFLLSQQWVLMPFLEANLAAQDIDAQDLGAGLTDIEFGLQTRFEASRTFAPFVEVSYERFVGGTADIARDHHEPIDQITALAGIRFVF